MLRINKINAFDGKFMQIIQRFAFDSVCSQKEKDLTSSLTKNVFFWDNYIFLVSKNISSFLLNSFSFTIKYALTFMAFYIYNRVYLLQL